DAAFARVELRLRLVGTAAIVIELGLLPFGERADVLLDDWIVDRQLGVEAAEPVRLRPDRDVVIRGEILDRDPRRPFVREPAREPRRLQLLAGRLDLGP